MHSTQSPLSKLHPVDYSIILASTTGSSKARWRRSSQAFLFSSMQDAGPEPFGGELRKLGPLLLLSLTTALLLPSPVAAVELSGEAGNELAESEASSDSGKPGLTGVEEAPGAVEKSSGSEGDSAAGLAKKAPSAGRKLPKRIKVSEEQKARLEQGEILVVTRKVEGSKVPEAVVHALVEASPGQVWPLLDQCNKYVGVMPRITKAEELTRKGFEVRCALTFSPPWPMSDMNSITRATHRPGPPVWLRAWELESGDYNSNAGHWLLQEFEGDSQRTLLEYRLHSEPKVSIPGFLQEMGVKSALPDLIKQLRDAVPKQASR